MALFQEECNLTYMYSSHWRVCLAAGVHSSLTIILSESIKLHDRARGLDSTSLADTLNAAVAA
jgi:hypothetical protein